MANAVTIPCSGCAYPLPIPAEVIQAGRKVRCPYCQTIVTPSAAAITSPFASTPALLPLAKTPAPSSPPSFPSLPYPTPNWPPASNPSKLNTSAIALVIGLLLLIPVTLGVIGLFVYFALSTIHPTSNPTVAQNAAPQNAVAPTFAPPSRTLPYVAPNYIPPAPAPAGIRLPPGFGPPANFHPSRPPGTPMWNDSDLVTIQVTDCKPIDDESFRRNLAKQLASSHSSFSRSGNNVTYQFQFAGPLSHVRSFITFGKTTELDEQTRTIHVSGKYEWEE